MHGHRDGGCVRTDQGGELASSSAFGDLLFSEFRYTLEHTADVAEWLDRRLK